MLQALSDGTSALTDLRVAVRMDKPAQVRKVLAEVGKSVKTIQWTALFGEEPPQ